MTTAVPSPTFTATGFTAPTQSAILTGVRADFNAAFGGNLNPSLETPQGQLATSLTAIVADADDQFCQLANSVDPAYASGRMQDAIGRIYFLSREPAKPTTVTSTCSGLYGVVIPAGALASATDGNIYSCTSGGTIPIGGTISLEFQCVTTGPIACPAGTLTRIYQAIPGWDTIINPADGVLGNDVESRSAFEARRAASVAINAVNTNDAIKGNVLAVANVIDAYVTDNPTGSSVTIGGVSVAAHSLYVCVSGGASADIADAIWRKKPPGCGMVGSTSVVVTDSNVGYVVPYPTYTISYQVAAPLQIIFAVSIQNSTAVPSNAAALIQQAIVSAFAGGDGGPRAQIGATTYASRFYAPIYALGPWVEIINVQIGSSNTPGTSFTGVIAGTALTVSSVTGTVAIGQYVQGAGVLDGTKIVSGSGSSWVVNFSQTVASEPMTGVTPALTNIPTNINQIPTVTAAEIGVSLV